MDNQPHHGSDAGNGNGNGNGNGAPYGRDSGALLTLDRVDVVLERQTVLSDIDWRLLRGRHTGIVGGNGSGKSTLLKLAGGLLWPAPGRGRRAYDFGRGPQRDAVHARRCVALVGDELQDRYARFGWNHSALDVVLSGLFRTDVPRRRATSTETDHGRSRLDEVGLDGLRDRRFLELSRGQQRRVLIARALAFQPDLLLLDEAAAGLDDASRAALHETIARIAAKTTIVAAEHATADLPPVCTDVLELAQGRIVRRGQRARTGRPRQLRVTRPASRPVIPVLAQSATVTRRHEDQALIVIEGCDIWLGSHHVLVDIDWRLEPGQHWLVRGGNGAGKSTFVRLLHGQLRPARGGRISWPALGNPRSIWTLRQRIGWLAPELQAAYRHPSTLRECVASGSTSSIGQTRRPDRTDETRIDELLQRFELSALASKPLSALSYGQFKRALICRALVNHPAVLLLDEPWEGLDIDTASLLNAELQSLADSGVQLICASHMSRHAQRYAHLYTHRLDLIDGRIAYAGPNALSRDADAADALHEN